MSADAALTCQEWYRVRRGEDELAWGRIHEEKDLEKIVFSYRASQELAFLEPAQKQAVLECLNDLSKSKAAMEQASVPVLNGGIRRMAKIEKLRILFTPQLGAAGISVSTIRGGKVLDPENTGPAPKA